MHARMDWDAPAPVKQRGLNLSANEAAPDRVAWRDPFHRRSRVNALTPTTSFPSAALKAGLQKVGEQLTADWIKKAGTEGQAVIEAYRKL